MVGWLVVSITPLGTIIATEYVLLDQQNFLLASIQFSNQWRMTVPSPWLGYLAIYSLLSVFLLWVSIQVVKRGEK